MSVGFSAGPFSATASLSGASFDVGGFSTGQARTATVQLMVQGASTAIDITNQLLDLVFQEAIRNEGCTLTITLADPDLLFMNQWNIANGTQVEAWIIPQNWSNDAQDPNPLDTGVMWVDTTDLKLSRSGYEVTLKCSSISPDMKRNQKDHTGIEGQSGNQQTQQVAQADGLNVLTANGANTPQEKRRDQDNENDYSNLMKKAKDRGNQIFFFNGQAVIQNEAALEQQAPSVFITNGETPLLTFNYKYSNLHAYASWSNSYHDPLTGKLVTNTVTAPNPPAGAKSKGNTSERPPFSGANNDSTSYPNDPAIDQGAPGSEDSGDQAYGQGPGYGSGQSPGSPD